MLCHPEGGRDDESRPPRNTICMMEYTVLRGRIKGKINDLGVHTDKQKKKQWTAVHKNDLHGPD